MNRFEELARAAAAQKDKREEEERLRKEQNERARQEAADLRDKAMSDHVFPLIREAQKGLDAANIKSAADLNRNAPTMLKILAVGHDQTPAAAFKQAFIRIEIPKDRFIITVVSQNAGPTNLEADASDIKVKFEQAFEDALSRWYGQPLVPGRG